MKLTLGSVASIDALTAFPFLITEIPTLKLQFPLYRAAAQDVDCSHDPLLFSKNHETGLQHGLKLLDKCC